MSKALGLYKHDILFDFMDEIVANMEAKGITVNDMATSMGVTPRKVKALMEDPIHITLSQILQMGEAVETYVSLLVYGKEDLNDPKYRVYGGVFRQCFRGDFS